MSEILIFQQKANNAFISNSYCSSILNVNNFNIFNYERTRRGVHTK